MRKIAFLIFLLIISVSLTAFSITTYIERYDLGYNEMGRFFRENDNLVYHEQAVEVYFIASILFTLITSLILFMVVSQIRRFKVAKRKLAVT
jgi:hypothetical protein